MTGAARRRVLVVQPTLAPAGGTEAVAAWMIEALCGAHDVGLVTWTPPDFDALNRWYGTSIRESEVTVHAIGSGIGRLIDAAPVRLALVRTALVARAARRLAPAFDVAISSDNELDLGRPGVQYIHYPRFKRPRPARDIRWFHRSRMLLRIYYGVSDRLMGGDRTRIARNLSLANSEWTASLVRALYPGSRVVVLPPPVPADVAGGLPWEDRENGFVCIGRFAAEKELDRVVEIVAAVRRVAPDVRLHLAGAAQSAAADRSVRRLARDQGSWLVLHENLSRAELVRLIGRQRYGIHGMRDEPFGIAPAEMVRGGCIVFLPDSGGQVDIVGGDRRLLFGHVDEAVARIAAVITNPGEQDRLRTHLAECADRYSVEHFMHAIREVVTC